MPLQPRIRERLARGAIRSAITSTVAVGLLIGATAVEPAHAGGITGPATLATPTRHCGGPSRIGDIGGIQWAQPVGTTTKCSSANPTRGRVRDTPPSPPFSGAPPLYLCCGGPVVGTASTPGELTITPVYWVPSGGTYSIPTSYEALINRFIADAATASGQLIDVFSVVLQYTNKAGTHLKYRLHAGTPITDGGHFPVSGCPPDSGAIWADGTKYSECITNAQLLSEAKAFTTSKGLPNTDLAHLYMYFMPKGVETCFSSANGAHGGSCSINANPGFCGYHAFAAPPLVADMNYSVVDSPLGWTCSSDAGSNTGGNQSPNGNIYADSEIDLASHEITETITDPEGTAWVDGTGNEIGDDCRFIYGDSSSFQGSAGARYNQTINGHHYFIQGELSNQDFKANNLYSCIQREDSVAVVPTSGPASTAVAFSGGGFAPSETVTVTYLTGLASPPSVLICSATSTSIGNFSCTGKIPAVPTAGATGAHNIVAKGSKSLRAPKATFTLT